MKEDVDLPRHDAPINPPVAIGTHYVRRGPEGVFKNLPIEGWRAAATWVNIAVVRAGISPKDFADAIGVSESSVKRWVDQGVLKAARTAGGHRRIAREEALRFIREQHGQVIRPEKLGLAASQLVRPQPAQIAAEQLFIALSDGREVEAHRLIESLFLGGQTVAAIGDEVVRPAMERIGSMWLDGPTGVFIEHRATAIALRAFEEVQRVLRAKVGEARPRAIVAGPETDPYLLPPALAALTLIECDWHATNLGAFVPNEVLSIARKKIGARLVALSVTSGPPPGLAAGVASLLAEPDEPTVIIGGQSAAFALFEPHPRLFLGQTLGELAAIARRL